ncbi:MAG: diguanylate cyclase [Desulfobacteraceae bacterium]
MKKLFPSGAVVLIKRFTGIVLILLCFVLSVDLFLVHQLKLRQEDKQTVETSLKLSALRARVEKEITGNLLLLNGTADFISVHPDLSRDLFNRYAKRVVQGNNLLKNLGAAPDFIMTYVYPLENNEKVIGIDYRNLPAQWEQVRKAKETGEMIIAGPQELIQGGWGLLGRAPVIIKDDKGRSSFWGIVSAVIDMDRLFRKTGVKDNRELEIAVRGIDGKGADGEVFLGDASLFEPDREAVSMPVTLPSGSWVMTAVPRDGLDSSHPLTPAIHGLMAVFFLITSFFAFKTVRKHHDMEQVKESLSEAQSIAHLGNWELNPGTDDLWWSEEVYRIFGVDRKTYTPSFEKVMELVHPDDRSTVEKQIHETVEKGESTAFDHRILLPDGQVKHVQEKGKPRHNASGDPVKISGTILDITERKSAELALAQEEKKWRAILEASYDASVMIDPEGGILFWSPSAEKMFGWTSEEAFGREIHELIAPAEYHKAAANGLRQFSRTGRGPVLDSVSEFKAFRKNGESFYVERTVTAFKSDGKYYAVSNLRDITERKKAEKDLQSYAERISLASEAGGVGIWEWDTDTNKLVWNRRMYEIYEVDPEGFGGLYEAWTQRLHPDDLEDAENELMKAVHSNSEWRWEFRILLPGNRIRYIQAAARSHRSENGQSYRMIGINLDITDVKEAQLELERMATTDSLTGIANRAWFMKLAKEERDRSVRYSRPLSLMMLDADRFKNINDTFGHDVGDKVLQELSKTAASTLRSVDIFGRIGGEEFAVLLPETDISEAFAVAERLRKAIEEQSIPLSEAQQISYTVSIGVSQLQKTEEDVESLLIRADNALYKAKTAGRNRVETAD